MNILGNWPLHFFVGLWYGFILLWIWKLDSERSLLIKVLQFVFFPFSSLFGNVACGQTCEESALEMVFGERFARECFLLLMIVFWPLRLFFSLFWTPALLILLTFGSGCWFLLWVFQWCRKKVGGVLLRRLEAKANLVAASKEVDDWLASQRLE